MSERKEVTVNAVNGDFQVKIPHKCVYCGGPAEATSGLTTSYKRGKRTTKRTWQIPYCNEHIALQKTYRKKLGMTGLFILFFIIFAFFSAPIVGSFGDKLDSGLGFVLMLGVGYIGASLVRGFLRKQKVNKNQEMENMFQSRYLGVNIYNYADTAKFTFTNPEIADEFAALNPGN
jgi:hypothetical protein